MTTDPSASRSSDGVSERPNTPEAVESDQGSALTAANPPVSSTAPRPARFTRASAAWAATSVALLLLILLIIFIAQNTTNVGIHFLGLYGSISLGLALLIAAVGGGVLVANTGVTRVTQLRMHARKTRREKPGR